MGCIWREKEKAFLLVVSLTRKIPNSPFGSRLPALRMAAKERRRETRRETGNMEDGLAESPGSVRKIIKRNR